MKLMQSKEIWKESVHCLKSLDNFEIKSGLCHQWKIKIMNNSLLAET